MRRKYIQPVTETFHLRSVVQVLESTCVPVGGSGGFDVKRHYGNWEIDWNGTQSDEDDWEEGERIF